MHFVIMKGDEIIDEFREGVFLSDLTNRLKTLYVKYQTQDIYMRRTPEGLWLKATFKFIPSRGGGMHPTKAGFEVVPMSGVPKPIQMNDLVGAWK